ncbi:MAG: hypothetical protein J6R80_04285 [Kiritimatiellae bacterium]|nr:hypothetical protein [Kiritimatiellia bacterium]
MMLAFAVLATAVFTRPMERVSTMDPAQARSVYDSHAIALVYETPLEIDYKKRPYCLVPGFCEMPEVSDDGLTYIFRRRAGANATKLTMADMARSLERLRSPKTVSPNAWIMKDVDTVRSLSSDVLEIKLKRRCHYFPWLMAMSASSVRGVDGEGSGPYVLTRWRRNHEMVFTRRSGDFDESGQRVFNEVRYLVIDDATTQWLMFLKGELDFLGSISRDNWDFIVSANGDLDPSIKSRGIRLHSVPAFDVLHVGINMNDPVLGKNVNLRRALNAAFDFPEWEKFYNGRIMRCDGPVPPGVEGRLTTPFEYSFNIEKARELMVKAGYPGGIDPKTGKRLVLTLSIGNATNESRESGELMASFYEKIGIKLELDFRTWDAFLRAVNDGRVQLYRMGWVGDYPDAQNFLQLFHSKNVSPGPNHSGYSNPEFDREYEAALDATTPEERNAHWKKCQELICRDCPWVFTHYNRSFSLTRTTVGNFIPTGFPDGVEKWYEPK